MVSQRTETETPLWTPNEVAIYLGISKHTVYQFIREGRLAASRVGNSIRIREGDVMSLLRTVSPQQVPHSEGRPSPSLDGQEIV